MVRKGLVLLLGLVLAVAIYSVLGSLEPGLVVLINSFAILVFFSALSYGELDGAVMGSIAGLVQDAFSHGVFGLAGLSHTFSGFLAGWLSKKLNLNSFYKRTVFIFFLSLVQLTIWLFFYVLIFRKSFLYSRPGIYLQPVFTAVLASLLVGLFRKVNKAAE